MNEPTCPKCMSQSLRKKGSRVVSNGEISKRYLCKVCGYKFYFRPDVFGKLRLKSDKGQLDLFLKTLSNMKTVKKIGRDIILKYDITPASVVRQMGYQNKVHRKTIWRWLNIFYPEWKGVEE